MPLGQRADGGDRSVAADECCQPVGSVVIAGAAMHGTPSVHAARRRGRPGARAIAGHGVRRAREQAMRGPKPVTSASVIDEERRVHERQVAVRDRPAADVRERHRHRRRRRSATWRLPCGSIARPKSERRCAGSEPPQDRYRDVPGRSRRSRVPTSGRTRASLPGTLQSIAAATFRPGWSATRFRSV
jgi:hypothetical protein